MQHYTPLVQFKYSDFSDNFRIIIMTHFYQFTCIFLPTTNKSEVIERVEEEHNRYTLYEDSHGHQGQVASQEQRPSD